MTGNQLTHKVNPRPARGVMNENKEEGDDDDGLQAFFYFIC